MKKRTKIVLVVLISLGTIVVAGIIAVAVVVHNIKKDLAQKIAAIRAAGEPLLFSELEPEPIPDAENAALVYEKTFVAMKRPQPKDSDLSEGPGDTEELDDDGPTEADGIQGTFDERESEIWDDIESGDEKVSEHMQLVGRVLGQNAEALRLIKKAARMPKCQFKTDYTAYPLEVQDSHIMSLWSVAILLEIKVAYELAKGDTSEAATWVRTALRLPRALKAEPMLISQLMRICISHSALDALRDLLNSGLLSVAQMDELGEVAQQLYDMDATRQALLGERTVGFTCIKLLGEEEPSVTGGSAGDGKFAPRARPSRVFGVRVWIEAEMANYLEMMNKYVAVCDKPLHTRMAEASKVADEISQMHELSFLKRSTRILLSSFTPAVVGTFEMDGVWLAMTRMGQVAIELERQKRKAGKYPDALKLLAEKLGETAQDPFTGKPLLYKKTDKGYLLWSVGPNEADDGAKNDTQLESGGDRDDVIWYGGGEEKPQPLVQEESP